MNVPPNTEEKSVDVAAAGKAIERHLNRCPVKSPPIKTRKKNEKNG
jgi:hypothetical protein